MNFEPMRPGFKSRELHFFFFFFFYLFIFFMFFLSLLLQCKFANSTLLSLLSFSYFITPYDAQASSAFSALIFIAGRPKAALLFWFFGDFRCGALLFMVIHVIYKYKNR